MWAQAWAVGGAGGSHLVAANVPWVVVLDSRGMSGAATSGSQGTGRGGSDGRA